MMRDCSTNRGGFDRVLMAVAATFLTMSATSAMAQDPSRSTPAELAIDAAVPRPEPANVPPPTAADFKMDTTASTPAAATAAVKPTETTPASVATAPAPVTADQANLAPAVPLPASTDTAAAPATTATVAPATTAPAAPAAASTPETASAPAAEPAVKVSTVAPADQPVADKIKDLLTAKNLRYFDRKAERAAVEKFYGARDNAPIWTQAGSLTDAAKGVIARLKDAPSDGLNASDYPVPDFATAITTDALDRRIMSALQFDGRRQFRTSSEMMAKITAEHLARHLERCGYAVMTRPARGDFSGIARGPGIRL